MLRELSLAEEVEACDGYACIAHGDRRWLVVDMRIDLCIEAQAATDGGVPQEGAQESQEEHFAHEEASRGCAAVLGMCQVDATYGSCSAYDACEAYARDDEDLDEEAYKAQQGEDDDESQCHVIGN